MRHFDDILERTEQRHGYLVDIHYVGENRVQFLQQGSKLLVNKRKPQVQICYLGISDDLDQLLAEHPDDHVQIALVLLLVVDELLDDLLVAETGTRRGRQRTRGHRARAVPLVEHVHEYLCAGDEHNPVKPFVRGVVDSFCEVV